jgi:hypothetical protein
VSTQAPRAVVLIRPHRFFPNPATAADNTFQSSADHLDRTALAAAAFDEVTVAAERLEKLGVTVHLFDDESNEHPDSVFPNNWFSTHSGGHIAIYPMHSPSRRGERRADVIELLKLRYRVQDVVDYSGLENDDVFLEGTGAMVFDHASRVAYTARSNRANPVALERFCTNFGYEPMVFDATDVVGEPIYHTNVLMGIATDFALIGLSTIADERRRAEVVDRLSTDGRKVIDLTPEQVSNFAGNAIELRGKDGRILAISSRGLDTLDADQIATIEQSCTIVPLSVPTIELAGGSVRCMMAGIHLDARPTAARG